MAKGGKVGALPKKLTVDFSGVEVSKGGANPRIDEGDYLFQVIDASVMPTKKDKTKKQILWVMTIKEARKGAEKWVGKKFRYRTGLWDEALWSVRSFLIDLMGEDEVPQSRLDIPLAKIVKKKPLIGASVEDDEYGDDTVKETSKISGTFPASDWANIKSATAADDDDDDDEEDEDEEEDEEEEDSDEEDEDEEEEDDEDEEEEEEEEKPKKKAKKSKDKKADKKKAKKKSKKDDDDDEDELDVDDL